VTTIEFRVLGSLEVLGEDRPLALGGAKQRAPLAQPAAQRQPGYKNDFVVYTVTTNATSVSRFR
jgi:hypothetical protein